MTTANHSTNQAPHGLGNLGQISEEQSKEQFKVLTVAELEALPEAEYLAYCANAFAMPTTDRTPAEIEASATAILKELNGHNPKPWVVVEYAGTVVTSFDTFRKAHDYIDEDGTIDGNPAEIMKRLDDGTLTTEF